jgi:hypothetical protein
MALDLNNDGWLDVINSTGSMWINDRGSNFSYMEHYNWVNGKVNDSISGSAICAGDLDNSGTKQLVVTDISSQKQDTWVFKFDADLKPIKTAVLPMPYYDRTTTIEVSHDVGCVVTDLNNELKRETPSYHELQIWCSDMWAVLWGAWRRGWKTNCLPEFEFSWGTSTEDDFYRLNIMHNAGVTSPGQGLFYKAQYMNSLPYNAELTINDNTASKKYWESIQKTAAKSVLL